MATINAASVLKQFDALVEQKELFYSPAKPIFLEDEGFEFEFRICSAFKSKPQLTTTTQNGLAATAQPAHRPPPTDGSDIDHTDPAFFISEIAATHKLILNKFCTFRPQHLLLTLDPTRRQTEPLDAADLTAAWAALLALDSPTSRHYIVYNGGQAGGSSRRHKHMQLLARPRAADGDLELVPDRGVEQLGRLPCVAFYEELSGLPEGVEEAGKVVARVARGQYRRAQEALGVGAGVEVPHNVMLTKEWIVTVPRRAATVEGRLKGHVVGCQGVMGSAWASNEEQVEAWKEVGLANVLRCLGVPK